VEMNHFELTGPKPEKGEKFKNTQSHMWVKRFQITAKKILEKKKGTQSFEKK
jgi:hypothetical protein